MSYRLQSPAARVNALEQADSRAEQPLDSDPRNDYQVATVAYCKEDPPPAVAEVRS